MPIPFYLGLGQGDERVFNLIIPSLGQILFDYFLSLQLSCLITKTSSFNQEIVRFNHVFFFLRC
jgi:hypothetical protein